MQKVKTGIQNAMRNAVCNAKLKSEIQHIEMQKVKTVIQNVEA